MRIVIAGAGDVGFHLAQLLTKENQRIVIIDSDIDVLENVNAKLDVLTIHGNCAQVSVLHEAEVSKCNLFLAVTTSEETNLLTCILAKQLGAKKVVARVDETEHLVEPSNGLFGQLGIDQLFSPRLLAAKEIKRLLRQSSFTDVFDFENGKISVVGSTIDEFSKLNNRSIKEIRNSVDEIDFRPFALLRGNQTIVPTSQTILKKKDHIYLMSKKSNLPRLAQLFNKERLRIKNVMIIGGNSLARKTAQLLEYDYNVTIISDSRQESKDLAEKLDKALVINGNPSNVDILKEEGLSQMDAFIALTTNSETNILSSLMAEQNGVYKTIAHVDNMEYTRLSQNIGVDTLINKRLIAANNVFRFTRKGKVEAIASIHGIDAELIEYVIHKENQLTKKDIRDLPLPDKVVIAAVIRDEEAVIPNGDFRLKNNDRVIVFAFPEQIPTLEKLFR